MSAPMSLSADDAVYATAMLMFATLPVLSMRKPRLQHLPPDACASPEPARLVAAAAFILLLWLQVRKQYLLGVSMVAINLVLRLYEIQRHTCHVTSRAVVVPASRAVRLGCTHQLPLLVPEVRWAALSSAGPCTARAPGAFAPRNCGATGHDHLASIFWRWTAQPRPPWRQSRWEALALFGVFGVAGSSSMALARALVWRAVAERGGVQGLATVLLATVLYPAVLLTAGTLAGRHAFCAQLVCRTGGGHAVPAAEHLRAV